MPYSTMSDTLLSSFPCTEKGRSPLIHYIFNTLHVVMDYYRPAYRLDRIRMMLQDSDERREGQPPLLRLRWLRTMVVDLSHTAERDADERMVQQRRSAVAVERVVCKDVSNEHLPQLLPFVTQCVPLLMSLDLRGCAARNVDDFLLAVADAHGPSLRRLYLSRNSDVAQPTLDRFTQLETLNVSGCRNFTNVDFCGATLRALYASECSNLKDAGLRRATRLEVLHVFNCCQVTDVSPFAHSLLELDACDSGIGSAALSDCSRLQVLNADGNCKIRTLRPFAQRLRELNAGGKCALNDAALADATGLVHLSLIANQTVTTLAPFGASLRRLNASNSRIGDVGLVTATNLVYLGASINDHIQTLAPFSASLLELRALGRSISQAALSTATNLIWLYVSYNEDITTVQSCGRSLRHLVAWGEDCALTNEGLSTATQLVTLNCLLNPNLTTIEPFLQSLEELTTDSDAQCLEVGRALNVHYIEGKVVKRLTAQLEEHGFIRQQLGYGSSFMHRNTVTYEL